jgi:hypothetical protein
VWDSARFTGFFHTSAESTSQTLSTPAHTQVTQSVRQPKSKSLSSFYFRVLQSNLVLILESQSLFFSGGILQIFGFQQTSTNHNFLGSKNKVFPEGI